MENKKLVIFDFDGVLVDTLPVVFSLSKEVNENLSLEEFKSFFHGNFYKAVRFDGTPRNRNPKTLEKYEEKSRELKIPIVLKHTLENLSKKYILTIVSSTATNLILRILERENCNFFNDVLGADIHASKVEKNKTLLEKYNLSPSNAVFITDTSGDIKEASECNIRSIAVTWGFHDREELEKDNPALIVEDPKNLFEAIEDVLK